MSEKRKETQRTPKGLKGRGRKKATSPSLSQSVSQERGRTQFKAILENGRGLLAGVGFLFFLHAIGLALLFDPINGLFDDNPVIEQDWGLHFHHLKSMQEFWQRDRLLWGYNPLFMAGYPSNTIQDLSIKLFEYSSLLLSSTGLDVIQGFKLVVFLGTASFPGMMYFSARNFFKENTVSPIIPLIAALLGTVYWWNSLPREMFFIGMVGFPTSSYLAVLAVSLFYRVANSENFFTPAHGVWLIIAAAILPLHFQAVAVLLPPAIALLITRRELLTARLLFWLGGCASVSLLANMVWLLPVLIHRGDDVSSTMVTQIPFFLSFDPLTFLKDYLGSKGYWTFRQSFWEKGFRLMLLILGSMGVWKLVRSGRREVGVMMACSLLTLSLLTYFGSLVPFLKGWQPLRFKVPFDLFLVLTSSYVVGIWIQSRLSKVISLLIPALLICGTITFLTNLVQFESNSKMKLRTRTLPEIRAIVEWIRKESPIGGRVLFEESGGETGFAYDGTYLSSFIPHWTGRQLIGGPINLYNDRHHFAEFHSGILFKRDILSLTNKELRSYFLTYNIGTVVAFHPHSIDRLLSVPGLVSLEHRIGEIHLMKVNQPLNWFLKGEGDVQASLNRIRALNIRGDEVILKYHWTMGLVSNPQLSLLPVKIDNDPIPFIKIIKPPSSFTLRIGS
jgi:hypothetical protein